MYGCKHSSTKSVIASKDKNTSPVSQTTASTMEENTLPLPPQGGLVGIAASTTNESSKRTDVVQKAQVSPDATKGKSTKDSPPSKERSSPQKTPPSLTLQL